MRTSEKGNIHEMAKWASQVADTYNKSITYVLMKIHEAQTIFPNIEGIKDHVLRDLSRCSQ